MDALPPLGRFEGQEHRFDLRVYFEDTDLTGVVYHANYLRFMERARSDMLLAAGLSEPRDTIEEVIEPYLIQIGMIARTARGRCLNAAGWKHLGLDPPASNQDGLFD